MSNMNHSVMNESKVTLISKLKSYFRFDKTNAILKKEIIGGLTTFFAMCYILAVNPALVGNSPLDPDNPAITASNYSGGLFLVTAISSFVGTLLMGLWARVPIALAPGMGLNAFFAFTVAQSVGFESALSVTILSGLLYFIVTCTPLRSSISKMLPTNFKIAIGASIGLFIAFLGLENARIIVPGDAASGLATNIGDFSNPLVILGFCLIILGLILHFAKIPGSMIITMIIGAVILVILCTTKTVIPVDFNGNELDNYGLLSNYSDFSSVGYVMKAGWVGFANTQMWSNPMTYIGVLSFLYMDFFDTTGSLIVIDKLGDFEKVDKNWMVKANQVDAVSTIIGASIGATTVTTFVESTTGIGSGARTGVSALVTSFLFALSIALWPILQVFMPINGCQPITSCSLVIIGAVMMSQIRNFEWEIFADIPMLFVAMLSMMLSNSIAHGLSMAIIIFVFMNTTLGLIQKAKDKKKVINDLTIQISDTHNEVNTREFHYLKRLNKGIIIIFVISVLYIILEACFKAGLF